MKLIWIDLMVFNYIWYDCLVGTQKNYFFIKNFLVVPMTDVLHLKAKKHGVEIWKSDWKSKNSWLNGFHLCLVCTKVVKMWKRSKKLTQTVSSAILQLGTTDSPLFWWRTCCIETRMHMTWDITHFHFWVFQVFYPSNQLQTIRFCVKKHVEVDFSSG